MNLLMNQGKVDEIMMVKDGSIVYLCATFQYPSIMLFTWPLHHGHSVMPSTNISSVFLYRRFAVSILITNRHFFTNVLCFFKGITSMYLKAIWSNLLMMNANSFKATNQGKFCVFLSLVLKMSQLWGIAVNCFVALLFMVEVQPWWVIHNAWSTSIWLTFIYFH